VVVSHYSSGAAYPIGGPGRIGRLVLAVIESHGGKVYTKAQVESIAVANGVCTGVVLKGGVTICGKKVISAIGAFNTFTKLIPDDVANRFPTLRSAREDLLGEKLPVSPAHAMTFLALAGTAESLGLPKANWWIQDDPRFPSVFISFPSAKDPSWTSRNPETSVCEIVVEARHETFEQWKGDPVKNRATAYMQLKNDLADQMCDVLFKHFPQLRDKVKFREASTPLSAEHFLGSRKGCAYGLACTPERFRTAWLKPTTDIKNLYLGAQDVVSCGVAGSQMGGVVAACSASFKTLMAFGRQMYL